MKSNRVALVLVLLAIIVVLAGLMVSFGPHAAIWPRCPLNQATGLHCPGCGTTRAIHSALSGDVVRAFRFNPLMMLLLPLFGGWGVWCLWQWIRDRPVSSELPIRRWVWLWAGVLVLMLAFGVLRNLPWWPLTLLAPP